MVCESCGRGELDLDAQAGRGEYERPAVSASVRMPRLKIAVQLASFRQPFRQALHTAARLGVAGVEIDARNQLPPEVLSRTGVRQIR